MQFAIWSLGLTFTILLSSNALSSARSGGKVSYFLVIRKNKIFTSVIRDPLFFPFVNHVGDDPLQRNMSTQEASLFDIGTLE